MPNLAVQLIAENKKTRATSLDLGNCGLTEIPVDIVELTWLESLSFASYWIEWDGEEWQEKQSRNVGPQNLDLVGFELLERLPALQTLVIENEEGMMEIGKLSRLTKLKALFLAGRRVGDLTVLNALPLLGALCVAGDNLSDLSPFAKLSRLQALAVASEALSDLRPLLSLTALQGLFVAGERMPLEPLAGLTSLKWLGIFSSDIADLTALADLTSLRRLNISDTTIRDLTPLGRVTSLESLDVSGTGVADLAPLTGMTSLKSLNVSGTGVADLAPLTGMMSLRALDISRTKVSDFKLLAQFGSLEKLYLSGTGIVDLTPLGVLSSLRALVVSNTKATDLRPLSRLVSLEALDLWLVEVADLAPLASLPALQTLNVSGTKTTDLKPLARLTSVKSLDVSDTPLSDLTPLIGLTSLQTLDVSGTKAVDLGPLTGLGSLKSLNVASTELVDLTVVAELTSLQDLDISGTKITDFEPLARLVSLESLRASNTALADLGPLAGLTSLRALDVSRTKIADLKPVGRLTSMRSLNAADTSLSNLTPLTGLTSLQKLNIAVTKATDLRPLTGLASLRTLDISRTEPADLTAVAALTSLRDLNISGARIMDFEPLACLVSLESLRASGTMLTRLTPLARCTSLQTLYISDTKVEDLGPLARLPSLKLLDGSGTELADLTVLANLTALRTLTVSKTKVTDVKPLAPLASLRSLRVSETPLADLTALADATSLRTLDVSGTRVTDLYALRGLISQGLPLRWSHFGWEAEGIYVKDCPLVNPPVEIVHQGNAAVLNYFRERETDELDHLYEAKMLIVGEGGAGKTSLLRRLYQPGRPLPTEKETTKGISIYRHDFELPNGRNFRLNVWDFGGQEIYHATHQFFLTRRSLYVLVDDTRRDYRSVSDTGFKYWLDLIDLFGNHSPVLIFQNEKAGRSKAIDLGGIKGRYDNVKELYAGNLEKEDAADRLREGIRFFASHLSHIGEQLPARWIKVRADIEARAAQVPYITQREYFDVYSRHMAFDRTRALHLSRYLHDLGVFLHFQDDPLLKRTVILQNSWATEAVFRILDDETVKARLGRFTAVDCDRIWHDSAYAEMHPELLALMENFELCYVLADTKPSIWLAPQLLPPAKPGALEHWSRPEDLVVRYHYDVMPKGLINRLTVRLNRFVRDPEMAWVTGVLLERDDTAVLVEVLPAGGEIEVRAQGPERKALLSVVAADLDALNESLEGLRDRVDKRIPCNCTRCRTATVPQFFAHRNLLKRKIDNRLRVECPSSYEDVDVLELLEGIRVDKLPGWARQQDSPRRDRTVRVFLASSEELREDRDEFDLYFRQQNDQLRTEGIYLEIVRWENFLDAMSETRLQDEYNTAVRECDVFVGLFFRKTGKFTEEEFDTAHLWFKKTGRPRIYTFFKNAEVPMGSIGPEVLSLLQFKKKLTDLGHFWSGYDSIEHLKRQFRDQLDRLLDAPR